MTSVERTYTGDLVKEDPDREVMDRWRSLGAIENTGVTWSQQANQGTGDTKVMGQPRMDKD